MILDGSSPQMDALAEVLWSTLERIRVVLNISDLEFADFLELTPQEFRLMRGKKQAISIKSCLLVAKRFNIGFDALITGKLDYTALAAHYLGHTDVLPDRYLVGAKSKMRTAITFLNYIESVYGWQRRALILRKHQVSERALRNPDSLISVKFASDLCEYVYRFNGNLNEIAAMGRHSAIGYKTAPFAAEINKFDQVTDAYDYVFGSVVERYIEQNFIWEVSRMDEWGCFLVARPNPDAENPERVQNPLVCTLRSGFLSCIPTFMNRGFSSTKKTHCVLQGDSYCGYEIRFPYFRNNLRSIRQAKQLA